MTPEQRMRVMLEVERFAEPEHMAATGHHGDCEGADEEFHGVMESLANPYVIVHPPADDKHRAWCVGDETRKPLPYAQRNAAIVAESDLMIAAPAEHEEQRRGGTWMTVRIARRQKKPLVIVYPDGTTREERMP